MHLVIRFLRHYALRYWPYYLIGIFAVYGTNQLTVFIPKLIKETLDALALGAYETALERVERIALFGFGIIVIRTISRLAFFNPGRAAEFRLRNHLVRHLLALPKSFHDSSRVGDLMSRAANDLQNVRALIGFASLQIVEGALVIPLTIQQMAALDFGLTLIASLMLAVAMAVFWKSAQMVMVLTRRNLEHLSSISEHILDTWSAIPVVQGFNAEPVFFERFEALNSSYISTNLRISAMRSFVMPVVTLLGSLGAGIVLLEGGRKVLAGELTIGSIAAFIGFISILVSKLMSFGWTLSVIQRGTVALRRVYALLDQKPGLPHPKHAMPAPVAGPCDRGRGYRLEVRNLRFAYPGERGHALNGISFVLEPGRTLGVFGATGSGKSTLLHVLARVYTPPKGTVFLNGVDVCDIPLNALRDRIALVPQDAFLFSATIRENILWGADDDADEDPERLAHVIDMACLQEDLEALPEGLDTLVGPRGVTLSGGQRQRVALARAFYRSFSLLFLDDVLAAVDHRTEQRLIAELEQAIHSEAEEGSKTSVESDIDGGRPPKRHEKYGNLKTTVIVSHRLSGLRKADLILVLEEGTMIDSGRHEALISRAGPYRETWLAQQNKGPDEHGADPSKAAVTPYPSIEKEG